MLIIRRSKLHYAASGIITLKEESGLKLLKYNSKIKFTHNIYSKKNNTHARAHTHPHTHTHTYIYIYIYIYIDFC